MSDVFLHINPKHKVPVLIVDDQALTENVAILQWIAERYPDAKLLPRDGMRKFKAISFLAWCAAGVHPHLTPNALPQRYCDLPDSADSVRRCAQTMLKENYQVAEEFLADRDWFFDGFTVTDVYFFWCFRRGMMFGVDTSGYPRCLAHFERVSSRASVKKLIQFEESVLANLSSQPAGRD
jgi:glutathione S-transferase